MFNRFMPMTNVIPVNNPDFGPPVLGHVAREDNLFRDIGEFGPRKVELINALTAAMLAHYSPCEAATILAFAGEDALKGGAQ